MSSQETISIRDGDKNPETEEKKLPFYEKLAFATGHVLTALAAALWYPYSIAFFTKVLELPPASVGTIVLVGQIGGAMVTPFTGAWSDRIPFKTWRRKPVHLLAVVTGAGSYYFLWHECINCFNAPVGYQVAYFSIFAVLYMLSTTCVQIAQLSLIPELTTDKSVKVELNSMKYSFTMVSFLTLFGVLWVLLVKLHEEGVSADLTPSDKDVFWIAALVVTGFGLLVSFPFQFFVHERPDANPPRLKWYKWFMNSRFWLVIFLYASTKLFVFFPFFYLPLYLLDTLHMDKASIAKAPLILYIFSIVTTFFTKRFSKLIGDEMTYFIGLVVFWGSMLWIWAKEPSGDQSSSFEWPRDSIYGAAVLLGVGTATCNIIALTAIAHLVGEYTGSSSFIVGWMMFWDRVLNGVLVKIVQQLHPDTSAGREVLGDFYRKVLVYTTLAASMASLLAIALMKVQDFCQSKKKQLLTKEANPLLAGALPVGPFAHSDVVDDKIVRSERHRETSMTS